MMESGIVLYSTAASVALVHTVLGPDHYLPFVAMSRAGAWSQRKTVLITLLCGLGHVLSSAILGLVGIVFGIAVFKLEWIEQFRGDLAGWLLLAFGMVYFLWGVRRAIRNQPHSHFHAHADGVVHIHEHTHHAEHLHAHADGVVHAHEHTHHAEHLHVHDESEPRLHRSGLSEPGAQATGRTANVECRIANVECPIGTSVPSFFVASWLRGFVAVPRRAGVTPWVLFTIFLFGPCEPLIPILMYAAAKGTAWTVVGVLLVFGVITIATMVIVVLSSSCVVGIAPLRRWQRFGHAAAGLAVLACGLAVRAGL